MGNLLFSWGTAGKQRKEKRKRVFELKQIEVSKLGPEELTVEVARRKCESASGFGVRCGCWWVLDLGLGGPPSIPSVGTGRQRTRKVLYQRKHNVAEEVASGGDARAPGNREETLGTLRPGPPEEGFGQAEEVEEDALEVLQEKTMQARGGNDPEMETKNEQVAGLATKVMAGGDGARQPTKRGPMDLKPLEFERG